MAQTRGRNVNFSSTDRLLIASVDRSEHKFSSLEQTLKAESENRPRLFSDENFLHVQSIIDENQPKSEQSQSESPFNEEKSEISDRSNHFVFSTMKGLNKEATMSLEQNLLHRKLLEKKQL
jgi:hypothetical protein